MTLPAMALGRLVRQRALDLGFDGVAIGAARRPEHGAAFERWLEAGFGAGMEYLSRTRAERLDPERLLPGVRSVVAVALSYAPSGTSDPGPPVARYARGRDYHEVMRPRLRSLADFIDGRAGGATRSRAAVDTSAVLERDLAAASGLGWTGKNTMLLSPALGSYVLLGIVLTTAEVDGDPRQPDRCGTCTACLDACPTGAFVAPHVLDARRCISYLTIEHRGPIDEDLRPALGEWAFGCDVCQEVCPWNRKALPSREPAVAAGPPLGPLTGLLSLDEAAFRARFRGSAIRRAGRSGLLRNAALVLGNRGDTEATPALEGARGDPDPTVSEAARWALDRIRRSAWPGRGRRAAPGRPADGAVPGAG